MSRARLARATIRRTPPSALPPESVSTGRNRSLWRLYLSSRRSDISLRLPDSPSPRVRRISRSFSRILPRPVRRQRRLHRVCRPCSSHPNRTPSKPRKGTQARPGPSHHSFPAPQAPLGNEAGEREQKHRRAMPQRLCPAFSDRSFPIRQIRGEGVKSGWRDDFTARLPRERFQQGAIGLQRTKFIGSGVCGPTGLRTTYFNARGVSHRRIREITPRLARNIGRFVNTGFSRRRLRAKADSTRVRLRKIVGGERRP